VIFAGVVLVVNCAVLVFTGVVLVVNCVVLELTGVVLVVTCIALAVEEVPGEALQDGNNNIRITNREISRY
jgi:hypothetical protein